MEMLTGKFKVTLDEKGRISLPAPLRRILNEENLKITQCQKDKCLWVFPKAEYTQLLHDVGKNTNILGGEDRGIRRRLFDSYDVDIDKSGRIQIIEELREFAGLSKECVVLGQGGYIEIWDGKLYNQYLVDSENDYYTASEMLGNKLKNSAGEA
jgi:MraZ protein